MKQEIVVVSFLVLPAVYLSGFFFAVRQVLNSTERGVVKALLILGLFCFLVLLSLLTFFLLALSTNPWAH
jgi:hypothetical protein